MNAIDTSVAAVEGESIAREVEMLTVELSAGDLTVYRNVFPINGASIAEVVAAMKEDGCFLNPLNETGDIAVVRKGRRFVLARYCTESWDGWIDAEITEITAHFDDDEGTTAPISID